MADTKKPVAVAKKVEAKKTAPAKEVKKVEVVEKVAEVKAEVKAEAKKAPAKKTTAKKAAPAKKVAVKETLVFQFNGADISEKDLVKKAKDAYKAAGNKDAVKDVTVYVNCNEGKFFPLVNGVALDGLFL